jgi:hypothetical protein
VTEHDDSIDKWIDGAWTIIIYVVCPILLIIFPVLIVLWLMGVIE